MDKKVLILIPVYDGVQGNFLDGCLSSLNKISYPKENFEILAVDDVSPDSSVEYIKSNYPEVRIIRNEKNLGFAGTNNVGLRYGIEMGFDYVFMLNQDTEVEPDFLTEAVKLAETDEKIGAVQSKLLLFDDKKSVNSLGNEIHYLGFGYAGGYKLADRQLEPREITYPSGAAVLLKVNVLKEVGLLNEEFYMYHEDLDLGWRIRLAGYQIMLAPKSVVYHKYEFGRSIQKYYFMERNRYLVLMQNYKLATLILILPAATLMDIAMFIYSFVGGWHKELFKVYKYFLNPKVWDQIYEAREVVQAKRKVKDKEVVRLFTGKIEFQDFNNPLLKSLVNPIFNLYWQVVRRLIWW